MSGVVLGFQPDRLAPKADVRNTVPHVSPGPSGGDAAPAMTGVIIGALIHGD